MGTIGWYKTSTPLMQPVQPLNPVVPNPCTLLGLFPPDTALFTCLDLLGAFFCLRMAPASQLVFAFEWEDPDKGQKGQLIWTSLPQGFRNYSMLFGEDLGTNLIKFPHDKFH